MAAVQTYVQGQHGENNAGLAPFDWGIGFALKHLRTLFILALIPAAIRVGLRYLEFFHPLSPRQSFVIAAVDISSKTWLLVAIMLVSIALFHGERYSLLNIGRKTLLTMPKVLMSSVALLIVVGAFFLAPWMYLFVLFLLWAPFFVAVEICAKSYRAEEAEDEDELDTDEDFIRSPARMRVRIMRSFADKPIWDLGFSRSIQFTANRRNFVVTVQLALLLLVALTLPLATVVAIAGFYHSFFWIVFESFFSYFVHSLVLGIACATFLKLLPREAYDEIGNVSLVGERAVVARGTGHIGDVVAALEREIPVRRSFRLHGKIIPFFLIALLGGLTTKATVDYILVNNSKPPGAQILLEGMEQTTQQLIFRLRLEDSTNLFRWLNPLGFRLKLIPDGTPAESEKKEAAPVSGEPDAKAAKPDKKDEMLEPERVMPFAIDGHALPEENFVPSKDPLKLVLYFSAEPLAKLGEGKAKGKYILYYLPLLGEPEPFLEGRFGDS